MELTRGRSAAAPTARRQGRLDDDVPPAAPRLYRGFDDQGAGAQAESPIDAVQSGALTPVLCQPGQAVGIAF